MIRTSMLALAIALSAGATRADDLSALVDRYVTWRGGSAFEQLQTVHQRGTVDASGLHGTGDMWSSRDGRQRIDIDLGAFKQTQAITPDQSWDTNVSGQVETTPTTIAQSQRHDLALEFADAFRGRGGAKATLLGVEQRDGASWSVVHLTFGDNDTYDAFIDPATGALDGFRITEDRQTRFERLSDWHFVGGVRMPFHDEVTTDVPGGNQSTRFETIELNHTFPDTLVARPNAAHKASFRDGASSIDWIPFELFGGNIFIPAKVNGHEVVVLLDSAAQSSVIDKGVAQSIGLKPKGETTVQGAAGSDTAGIVGGVTVELGDLKLSDLTVISPDLKPMERRLGHPLPFVLGDEIFSEVAVDIDFAHRRIAFRNPAHIARPQGAAEVPLVAVLGLRSIPVSVEGAPPVQFHFNLGGMGSALMVYPVYSKARGLLDGRRTSQQLGSGGPSHPDTVATVCKVELAGITFSDMPTIFPPEMSSAVTNTDRISGAVGLPLLARFHLVVDYAHDRIWMTPELHASAPFAKDRMGLLLLPKDRTFEVGFVSPGSPADKAGLKAGDRIRSINHKPPSAWPHDVLTRLSEEAAGTRVEVTMADGKVRRLTLKDYF
jgi:hypothetical protein